MSAEDLKCGRCGAPIPMPNDFGVWLVRCQYCGFDHELPDRRERQAFDKQRRADAERATREQVARANTAQPRKRPRRLGIALLVVLPIVLTFAIGGIVAFSVSRGARNNYDVPISVTGVEPPPPEFTALTNKAMASGCLNVIDGPELERGEYSGSFKIVKRECLRFIAIAKTPAPLTLQITDASGKTTTQTAPTGSLEANECAPEDQNHLVKIAGAPEFWVEALNCPRTFGNDATTTGMSAVSTRLKHLMTHGCYEISLAATTVSDSRKLTTSLEAGACFDVLAATGVSDNAIGVKLSTPFGETIEPMPAPGTNLEVPYCASASGPYVVELTPAIDGPFTMAVAICNRAALPKLLPKATK